MKIACVWSLTSSLLEMAKCSIRALLARCVYTLAKLPRKTPTYNNVDFWRDRSTFHLVYRCLQTLVCKIVGTDPVLVCQVGDVLRQPLIHPVRSGGSAITLGGHSVPLPLVVTLEGNQNRTMQLFHAIMPSQAAILSSCLT